MWIVQLEATHITQPIHAAHSQHAPSHQITHSIPIVPPIQPNTYFTCQIHICSSAQKCFHHFFVTFLGSYIQRRGSSLQTTAIDIRQTHIIIDNHAATTSQNRKRLALGQPDSLRMMQQQTNRNKRCSASSFKQNKHSMLIHRN